MKHYMFLVMVISALVFSGCASIPTSLATIENPQTVQKLVKTNSLIFGNLLSNPSSYYFTLVARNQQTKHIYIISAPPSHKIFSKFKDDNRNGFYFSFLPAGDYVIERVTFTDMVYDGSVNADMSFTVPEHAVVYLGALEFNWETTKNYFFSQRGNIRFLVQDHSEDGFSRLWKRFPDLKDSDLDRRVSLIRIKGEVMFETEKPLAIPDPHPEDKKVEYHPLTSENINKAK